MQCQSTRVVLPLQQLVISGIVPECACVVNRHCGKSVHTVNRQYPHVVNKCCVRVCMLSTAALSVRVHVVNRHFVRVCTCSQQVHCVRLCM